MITTLNDDGSIEHIKALFPEDVVLIPRQSIMLNQSIPMLSPILGIFIYFQMSELITKPYKTICILRDPACVSFEIILHRIQVDTNIPIIVYALDSNETETIFTQAHNYEDLYVFLFQSADNFRLLDGIQHSLSSATTKMVFLLEADAPMDVVESLAIATLSDRLQRYVLIRTDGRVWLQYAQLERYALNLNNTNGTISLMERVHFAQLSDVIPSTNVTVHIYYAPPHSWLATIPRKNGANTSVDVDDDDDFDIEIIGTDSLMTYDIAQQLNVQPEICSNVAMYANYREWFKASYQSAYMQNNGLDLFNTRLHRWRASHIFDINSVDDVADLYCTSEIIDPQRFQDKSRNRDYLYPHASDCMSIVVPVNKMRKTFLQILGHQAIVVPVVVVTVLLAIVRVSARRESAVQAVLLTFGTFLAQQNAPEPRRFSEKLWLCLMLLIALLASMVVSSTMYKIVMTITYEEEIDTMEQLIESGLPIFMLHGLLDYYNAAE